MSREYPPKTGECAIIDCKRKPTDWHHIISQAQIIKRGLPESMFTDPGNLQELCRHHHDMTTASISRKQLTKKHGPMKKRKGRMTHDEFKSESRKRRAERRQNDHEALERVMDPSIEIMHSRGAANPELSRGLRKWGDGIWPKWKDIPPERLYPPDHWLHDPKQYDADLSDQFEGGNERGHRSHVWSRFGGAKSCHDNWRQSGDIPAWVPYRESVVCAKCNRMGHESKKCRARTIETSEGPLGKMLEAGKEGLPRR